MVTRQAARRGRTSLGIRGKLQLLFGLATGLILSLLVVFVYIRVSSLVRDLLAAVAAETASRSAEALDSRIDDVLIVGRTLGSLLEAEGGSGRAGRAAVESQLAALLDRSADYLGAAAVFEPGRFDGQDAEFRSAPGGLGNEAGRFALALGTGDDDVVRATSLSEAEIESWGPYLEARKSSQESVAGPSPSLLSGKATPPPATTIAVPVRDRNQAFLGALLIEVSQASFQRIVEGIRPYERGFALLYGKDARIAAQPAGGQFASLEEEAGDFEAADFGRYREAVLAGAETFLRLERGGEPFLVAIRPFRVGSTYTRWTLAVFTPEEAAMRRSGELILILGLAGAAALVVVLGLVVLASAYVAKPIKAASLALRDIAEGEGDLGVRLPVLSGDETGELARHFNAFVARLESAVSRLKGASRDTAKLGDELAASSEEASATVTELGATVGSLEGKISSLDASIRRVEEAVGGIAQGIDGLDGLAGRQAEAASASSAAAREIMRAVADMERIAEERSGTAEALAERAREGQAEVGAVLAEVEGLGGGAAKIAEMAALIDDVAERTKLLAMNAAIEAAHAGQQGKGFAVVADEIRKLAQATGQNAATIAQQLSSVSSAIDRSAAGAAKAGASIAFMTSGMADTASSLRELRGGLAGLARDSGGLSRAMEALAGQGGELRAASSDIDGRSEVIRTAVGEIGRLSAETSQGFTEMARGIHEMGGAAQALAKLGIDNSRNVAAIDEELGHFKAAESAQDCGEGD